MSDHYWYLWCEKKGCGWKWKYNYNENLCVSSSYKVCPTPRIKTGDFMVLPNFQASLLNQYQEWQSHSLVACHADRETQQRHCLTSTLPFCRSGFPWHSHVSRIPPLLMARSRQTGLVIAMSDTKCSPQTFEFFVGTTKSFLRTAPSHSTRWCFALLSFPIGKLEKDNCSALFLAYLRPLVQFITQQWSFPPILIPVNTKFWSLGVLIAWKTQPCVGYQTRPTRFPYFG